MDVLNILTISKRRPKRGKRTPKRSSKSPKRAKKSQNRQNRQKFISSKPPKSPASRYFSFSGGGAARENFKIRQKVQKQLKFAKRHQNSLFSVFGGEGAAENPPKSLSQPVSSQGWGPGLEFSETSKSPKKSQNRLKLTQNDSKPQKGQIHSQNRETRPEISKI